MKRTPAHYTTERAGLIAIDQAVNGWGWMWRPTTPPDTGVDGTIEVADASTATGKQLAVQSKSGRSYFRNETETTFEFLARSEDVEYWRRYALPVLLMVYDPTLACLYALSIKDYLRDKPDAGSKPYRFVFHKEADLVSDDAHEWIRAVAFGHPRSYETRLAVTVQEVMHTNLLPVLGTPNGLYSAQWMKEDNRPWIDDVIFIDKASRCWTFHDPTHVSSSLQDHIDIATVRTVPWTEAIADAQLQSYVFELLYRTLRAHLRGLPIAFDKARTRYYFLPKEGQARTWRYQSLRRKAERKVAHPFSGKYWAHHAAKFTWEFHGNRLFLKIVPAYVFTENGSTVQADEDVTRLNVKKRKREYNRQVFQHLIFWREILAKDGTQIRLTAGAEQALLIDKNFVCQQVTFGIYDDKQSFSTITEPIEEAIDESAFLMESEDELTSDEDAYDQSDEAEADD